jgi:hypothetical protein
MNAAESVVEKGWKLLRLEDGRYTSFGFPLADENVPYAVGRRTVPKPGNGPLAVFATQGDAVAFFRSQGAKDMPRAFALAPCEFESSAKSELWAFLADGKPARILPLAMTPPGTRLAAAVTLTAVPQTMERVLAELSGRRTP